MIAYEQLREYVLSGMSDPEIADREGVSARTVLRWRQRASLPSLWEPMRDAHGTLNRYRAGCRCAECRSQNSEATLARARAYNAATLPAWRSWEPWTAADDVELRLGAGTVLERAQRLGRSWSACVNRLEVLRRKERLAA